MKSLRVAIWGLGRHAINNILPAVSAADGLALYGVCSRDARTVSSYSEKCKCKGWTDPALMLRDPEVEVVYVATPIGLHAEHGKQVLDAGRHLWCEKPLTRELPATLGLLDAARKRRLSICEGFMYLYHPQFARLCKYVTDGALGKIRSVACRFGIPALEHPGFRSNPLLGGGALFDVGSYPVSALNSLFPEEKLQILYAAIDHRNGAAVDTDGRALLALSSGAVASLEWRTSCAYRNERCGRERCISSRCRRNSVLEGWGERLKGC